MFWKQISKMSGFLMYGVLGIGLSLTAVLAAANYAKIANRSSVGSDIRIAGQYIRMKARQSDIEGYISVQDGRMVYMLEEFPEGEFVTDLYSYQDWLMECLHAADVDPELSAGDQILPCDGFTVQMHGNVLSFSMDSGNSDCSGALILRGGEGGL